MPDLQVVALPMGMGKTRIVLKNLLWGSGTSKAIWNRKLRKTIILGPNGYVERSWLREIVLLAIDRTIIKNYTPDSIGRMTIGKLRKLMTSNGLIIPYYSTYTRFSRTRKEPIQGKCHYLIMDEWHSARSKIHEYCKDFKQTGRSRRWYIGGKRIAKKLYFVSATPVNPVLEEEVKPDESPFDDSHFEQRMTRAREEAIVLLCGMSGREMPEGRRFFDVLKSMGAEVKKGVSAHGVSWKLPKGLGNGCFAWSDDHYIEKERSAIKNFMDESMRDKVGNSLFSQEYAYSVGLVRTKIGRTGDQVICSSKKGRSKSCFGFPYDALYIVEKERRKATSWLLKEHTRVKRLLDILISQDVIAKDASDQYSLGNKKALIFCTHRGVALGLTKVLLSLNSDWGKTEKMPPIVTNVDRSLMRRTGKSSGKFIDDICIEFNEEQSNLKILVATDILSESVDLHHACKLLVLCQNSS